MQHVTRLVDGGIGRRVAEGKAEEQGERGSVQHLGVAETRLALINGFDVATDLKTGGTSPLACFCCVQPCEAGLAASCTAV